MVQVRAVSELGALIREHRRKLGLDQAELAKRVGVNRKWVIAIEAGKSGAELGLVLRTLEALGLRVSIEEESPGTRPRAGLKVPDIDAIVERARKVTR